MAGAVECACGFRGSRADGIIDLMTPAGRDRYDEFARLYDSIRALEGWGTGDLDLPFAPRRHAAIWAVRRRTFNKLRSRVRARFPRGGSALDVGAGNCWLTAHLARWGFRATALDVSAGRADGLGAGDHHLANGLRFERIRAPMESLPFPDAAFDVSVASASLHYTPDLETTLAELKRVTRPSGAIWIADSPWYEDERDGRRALEQGVHRMGRLGLPESAARRASFLCRSRFEEALARVGLTSSIIRIWPGAGRTLTSLRARLKGQRVASFPLIELRSADR